MLLYNDPSFSLPCLHNQSCILYIYTYKKVNLKLFQLFIVFNSKVGGGVRRRFQCCLCVILSLPVSHLQYVACYTHSAVTSIPSAMMSTTTQEETRV